MMLSLLLQSLLLLLLSLLLLSLLLLSMASSLGSLLLLLRNVFDPPFQVDDEACACAEQNSLRW